MGWKNLLVFVAITLITAEANSMTYFLRRVTKECSGIRSYATTDSNFRKNFKEQTLTKNNSKNLDDLNRELRNFELHNKYRLYSGTQYNKKTFNQPESNGLANLVREAIKNGDSDLAIKTINLRKSDLIDDINTMPYDRGSRNTTLLDIALENEQYVIAKALLKNKINNPNAYVELTWNGAFVTLLERHIKKKDAIALLLKYGAKLKWTYSIVSVLLEEPVSENSLDILDIIYDYHPKLSERDVMRVRQLAIILNERGLHDLLEQAGIKPKSEQDKAALELIRAIRMNKYKKVAKTLASGEVSLTHDNMKYCLNLANERGYKKIFDLLVTYCEKSNFETFHMEIVTEKAKSSHNLCEHYGSAYLGGVEF